MHLQSPTSILQKSTMLELPSSSSKWSFRAEANKGAKGPPAWMTLRLLPYLNTRGNRPLHARHECPGHVDKSHQTPTLSCKHADSPGCRRHWVAQNTMRVTVVPMRLLGPGRPLRHCSIPPPPAQAHTAYLCTFLIRRLELCVSVHYFRTSLSSSDDAVQ